MNIMTMIKNAPKLVLNPVNYVPMEKRTKAELVARGEQRLGQQHFIGGK